MVLLARAAAATPIPASPRELPIFFDTRAAETRPIIVLKVFGRSAKLLLDTGAGQTVIGPKAAGIPLDVVQAGHVYGTDYSGRPIVGVHLKVFDLRLPAGWPSLGDEFLISDWIDRQTTDHFIDPGQPHFDGVIAPITLAAQDRVVVIDFGTRTMSVGSWDDAQKRLGAADRALTASFGSVDDGGKLIVPVVVQGRSMRLALDTGAPDSVLYVPRDVDLPPYASRVAGLTATIEAGEVRSKVRLDMWERIEQLWAQDVPSSYDGLLGMDVLRSCILAFDDRRFLVRCRSDEPPPTSFDLRSMRSPRPLRTLPVVEIGAEGLPVTQHPNGSYDWNGRHVAAVIHKDGRVTYSKAPASPDTALDRMDPDEEKRWFEEQAAGFLTTLARANERQTIVDALDALPRFLAQILDDRRLSLVHRRRILFLLWDEMAEADDRDRGWAGTEAREIIDGFVRTRLPIGSPNGYSADELAALNRGRPKGIAFDPYRPAAKRPDPARLDDR
jgi:hypothetical protein